jgi:hypothetical protein
MLAVVAVGCGIILGLTAAEAAGPFYWRLLAACPLGSGRWTRRFLGAHRAFLARAGYHPYLVDCLAGLEQTADPVARTAARGRLRWWCAVRLAARI